MSDISENLEHLSTSQTTYNTLDNNKIKYSDVIMIKLQTPFLLIETVYDEETGKKKYLNLEKNYTTQTYDELLNIAEKILKILINMHIIKYSLKFQSIIQ